MLVKSSTSYSEAYFSLRMTFLWSLHVLQSSPLCAYKTGVTVGVGISRPPVWHCRVPSTYFCHPQTHSTGWKALLPDLSGCPPMWRYLWASENRSLQPLSPSAFRQMPGDPFMKETAPCPLRPLSISVSRHPPFGRHFPAMWTTSPN